MKALSSLTATALCAASPALAAPANMAEGSAIPQYVLQTAETVMRDALAVRILAGPQMRKALEQIERLFASHPLGSTAGGQATLTRAARNTAMFAINYAIQEAYVGEPALKWYEAPAHQWDDLSVPGAAAGGDNPTQVYRSVILDPRAKYVITGKVKMPGPVQFHIHLRNAIPGSDLAMMGREAAVTHGFLSSTENFALAADGSFTATLDTDPANGRQNHLQAKHDGQVVIVARDVLTDWGTQNIYSVDVRKVAGPPAPPRPSDQAIAERSAELAVTEARYWLAYFDKYGYSSALNTLPAYSREGGRGAAAYAPFRIADDEALVLTLDPADAAAMDFQIMDPWGINYEYVRHLSSANFGQSRADADGTYTYVIAPKDPGVYNWLDPTEQGEGMGLARWQGLAMPVDVEKLVLSVKLVKAGELKSALPQGTAFVTPAERKAQLDERMRTYLRVHPPVPTDAD